jgi:hypothetical protein
MKVSVPALAAAMPPETGASTACTLGERRFGDARAVATSIVEQSIRIAPLGAAPNTAFIIDLLDMLAGGQHRHDRLGAAAASARWRREAAGLGGVERLGGQIEGADVMPALARFAAMPPPILPSR